MNNYDELIQVKESFDSNYKKHEYIYTFIAPKDNKQFEKFRAYAINTPTLSGSINEVLSDKTIVLSILQSKFPKDIELEIYFATDDHSSFPLQGTLHDYIKKENINFNY